MPAVICRRIVHLDLAGEPPSLPCDPGASGVRVVAWRAGVPVTQLDLLARDLPVSRDRLAERLREAVAAEASDDGRDGGEPSGGGLGGDGAAGRASAGGPDAAPAPSSASVVVCTRDRPEALARCLESLAALADRPGEIVVVDNAPSTGAARRLAAATPGARYVLEPRPGLDAARNAGVLASRGEVVAFTDDDVTVHPAWLGRLVAGLAGARVMAVTGLVLPAELDTEAQLAFETCWGFGRGFCPRTFGAAFFRRTRRLGVPVWEIGAGASMAFRRRAFDLVGLFDERLDVGAAGCSGDSELWYRLLAEGWECRYEPAAVAFHRHRRSRAELERQLFAYMRGHVAALLVQFERYGHWGNLRRAFVTLPAAYLALLAHRAVRGPGPRQDTLWPEVRGCLSGLGFYLRHRRRGAARGRPGPLRGRETEA